MAALGVISTSICAPALPFIADRFAFNFSQSQFTMSIFLLGNAFGQFFSGPMSDRFGKKKILLSGLAVYILASVACGLAESSWALLAARFFQGAASSVGPVIARAIGASTLSLRKLGEVQSYASMGIGIASILAILCSGYISLISWRGNFFFAAGLGFILFCWAFNALRKIQDVASTTPPFHQIGSKIASVFRVFPFWSNTLYHSLSYGLMYAYIGFFPFLLKEGLKITSSMQIAGFSVMMILVYMAGSFISSRLVFQKTIPQIIFMGIFIQLFSGLLIFLSNVPWTLVPSLMVFNFSLGVIIPMTSAAALSPFDRGSTGLASSLLGLSYRFLGALLSIVIGAFALAGGKNLGIAILACSALSLFIFARQTSDYVRN